MREEMVGRMRRPNMSRHDGRKRREKPGSSEWKTGDVGVHTQAWWWAGIGVSGLGVVARREVETLMEVCTTSIKRADHSSAE